MAVPTIMQPRLMPPPENASILVRRRLDQYLAEAAEHKLTILAAPAGSGKTIALAGLAYHGGWTTVWCRMRAEDSVEQLLQHLLFTFQRQAILEDFQSSSLTVETLVNALEVGLNDETLLILDDYHLIDSQPRLRGLIESLLNNLPQRLHLVLAGRCIPQLDQFSTLLARGDALLIGQAELAFQREDTILLFKQLAREVPHNIDILLDWSRGWPLAIQLLTRRQEEFSTAQQVIERDTVRDGQEAVSEVVEQIYAYFKHEVFDQQPEQIRTILLETGLLLNLNEVQYLYTPEKAERIIPTLQGQQLFIEQAADGQIRYQPLFQTYLLSMAHALLGERQQEIHKQLAAIYEAQEQIDRALHHLLEARLYAQAVRVLGSSAQLFLEQNRPVDLLVWIQHLPNNEKQSADIRLAAAEAERRLLRFSAAQQHFAEAQVGYQQQSDLVGQARALRGQALVFLDTVNPAGALPLLKQALKLMPHAYLKERAELVRLQSENWTNAGRIDVALLLEKTARRLLFEADKGAHGPGSMHGSEELPPRLLLRSGRLLEACAYLERELGLDVGAQISHSTPTLHREPLLLLSFIDSLLGNGIRALALARRSLLDAQQRDMRLMEAIAHMRIGHAVMLTAPRDSAALEHYQQALELIQAEGVLRTAAEAYMGLALFHGHGGDLASAEEAARAGLHIATKVGDVWTEGLLWLAIGGAAVAHKDERALAWLEQAEQRFQHSADNYGQAVVALWRTIRYDNLKQAQDAQQSSLRLFQLIEQGSYNGLLSKLTLFGPRDQAMLVPILLRGRTPPLRTTHLGNFAEHILQHAFPAIAHDEQVERYYPGFTLRVQLLGDFRIWRGSHEIQAREWQRDKSRQLLQLLLTYRGQWVHREQLCAWLWPESDMVAAERQFKVTLNALNVALEPSRPPRTNPFFIRRQGLAYSFAPSSGCWIDVDEFELRLATIPHAEPEQAIRNGRIAVQLYKGDFLPELLYEPWTFEERERLLARYLSAATGLAAQLLERDEFQDVFELCEQVLRRDRCYEEAYQLLIRAHARAGSRSQALRMYARCVRVLKEEMEIEPLPETTELAERIKQDLPV